MSVPSFSYAEAPAIGEAVPARRPLSEVVGRNFNRLRTLGMLVGEFGVARAARVVYDAKLAPQSQESDFEIGNQDFREPVHLTSSLSDIATYLEIAKKRVYELPRELMDRVNGRPIADIGANIGLSAVYFASRYPDSPITALEPHPRNFAHLSINADAYGGQIDPVNAAVSSEGGMVGMRMTPGSRPDSHVSYVYEGDVGDEAEPEARAICFLPDEICLELAKEGTIGLLKVDIEGAERQIFDSGAMDELLENTEVMVIETHDRYAPGSAAAVEAGAARGGLRPYGGNSHTSIYARPRRAQHRV